MSGNAGWLRLSSMKGRRQRVRSIFRIRLVLLLGRFLQDGHGTIVRAFLPTQEFEIDQTLTVSDSGIEGFFRDWSTPTPGASSRG